jgi:hypothetical protein
LAAGTVANILGVAGIPVNAHNRAVVELTSKYLGKMLHTEAVIEAMLLAGTALSPRANSTIFSFKDPCCACVQLDWVQGMQNNMTFVSTRADDDVKLKSKLGYRLAQINDANHPRTLYYVVIPHAFPAPAGLSTVANSYNGPL